MTSEEGQSKKERSRRMFLTFLGVIAGVVTLGGMVPWVNFMTGSTEAKNSSTPQTLKDANGTEIKTTDLTPNSWKTFVWPYTGDSNLDSDTFHQWVLIRLPDDTTPQALSTLNAQAQAQGVNPFADAVTDPLTGGKFVAYSRVCVHLWCLWSYVPNDVRMECPCHGSQYTPTTGLAVAGPASLQACPNNQLPMLNIKVNSDGTISTVNLPGTSPPSPVKGTIGYGQFSTCQH
jgi:rieske iron-sulfur protein